MVTVRPYYSPDPNGPNYEQYCRQRLMLHISFRHMSDLLGENDTYAVAYHQMLQSANLPLSLEEDVRTLEQFEAQLLTQDDNTVTDDTEVRHVDGSGNIMHIQLLLCSNISQIGHQSDKWMSGCLFVSIMLTYNQ